MTQSDWSIFPTQTYEHLVMTEFADKLCSERHYESVEIHQRKSAVLDRRSKEKATVQRRQKLEDCRRLMVFLQDCAEVGVCVWVCVGVWV